MKDARCSHSEASNAEQNISLDGLRTALQRFDDDGQQGKCGDWEIHLGGYDRWWELCYGGVPVVSCTASGEYRSNGDEYGNLERECYVTDKVFTQICDLISSAYLECRMSPYEQKKIHDNSQALGR